MKIFIAALAFTLIAAASRAEVQFRETRFVFASVEQGRQILANRDDFVQRLSSFDRAARLKKESEVSEAEFLNYAATNTLEFNERENDFIESHLQRLKPQFDAFKLPWPKTIYIIKTTGNEEGGAAYTRANAIVLPAGKLLPENKEPMDRLLCHELFHILSRQNPALKEALYGVIGFQKCNEIPFPPNLVRITNPDAPKNDHWIELTANGKRVSAIPILFANAKTYGSKNGGEFFNYLTFKFLIVQKSGPDGSMVTYDAQKPILFDPGQAEGFFEQVGRNTQYIIHPEEILADNFALLFSAKKEAKSPEVLARIRKALEEFGR